MPFRGHQNDRHSPSTHSPSTARFPSRGGKRLRGHLGARAGAVPAIRLTRAGEGLGGAHTGTAPAHRTAAHLGQDHVPIIQVGAVAVLLIGEGMVAVASLEAREARFLPSPVTTRRKHACYVLSSRANTSCSTWEWSAAYSGKAARRSFSSASWWKRVALLPCPRRHQVIRCSRAVWSSTRQRHTTSSNACACAGVGWRVYGEVVRVVQRAAVGCSLWTQSARQCDERQAGGTCGASPEAPYRSG